MSTKSKIPKSDGVYFVTFTCYQWLPLFEITKSYDVAYKWFDYLKTKGHHIIGYVIMPNHIHVLIAFRNSQTSINTIIGNGKRFMAYEMVKRLQEMNETELLQQMTEGVGAKDYKRGKLHEVFEASFDWKECRSNKFSDQKLDYMHDNPCRGAWNLAGSPALYLHNSAQFYIEGGQGEYEVLHCGQLEDMDLTKSNE